MIIENWLDKREYTLREIFTLKKHAYNTILIKSWRKSTNYDKSELHFYITLDVKVENRAMSNNAKMSPFRSMFLYIKNHSFPH